MDTLLQYIVPILGATGLLGALTTYFTIRGNAPKTMAEAKKIEAEARKIGLDTVVDEHVFYENYASRLEKRISDGEDKNKVTAERLEKRIRDLETLIEEKDKAHALVVTQKDKRIDDLEARILELERELVQYKTIENKVEEVRTDLHDDVEKGINKLTK